MQGVGEREVGTARRAVQVVVRGRVGRGDVVPAAAPDVQGGGEQGGDAEAAVPAQQEGEHTPVHRRLLAPAAHPGGEGGVDAEAEEEEEEVPGERHAHHPQPQDRPGPGQFQPAGAQRVRQDPGRVEPERGRGQALFVEVQLVDDPVAVGGVQVGSRAQQPGGLTGVRRCHRQFRERRRGRGGPRRRVRVRLWLWLLRHVGGTHAHPPMVETRVHDTRCDGASA